MASYDEAVQTLYQGSLETFVAERKRLAGELKGAGDKEGAARLAKLGRPSISAWVVNQLFWYEREAFERLLSSAERLRKGEHDAGAQHQRTLTALRALAAARLESGGHAAPESTLRRVATTLSALAAAGTFDPDPPGALVADRDPPGFDASALGAWNFERAPKPAHKPSAAEPKARDDAERKREHAETERKKAEQKAEQERKRAADERRILEEAQARKRAERERLQVALSAARADAVTSRRDVERLRHELSTAERKLEKADATVAELKEALAALG